MILVTGSEGLIGQALTRAIEAAGGAVRRFDIRRTADEDIRSRDAVAAALDGVEGVVHLAAVSRVVWGERDPALCRAVNVDALRSLIGLLRSRTPSPWLLFASSREVYGNRPGGAVHEDDLLQPLNVYARTKTDGEALVAGAAAAGLVANICRFSSVYGSPDDHADRVVMAFANAALEGGTLRLEGGGNTFDFTEVNDVVRGLVRLVERCRRGDRLPPIHFASGKGTTLQRLAELAAVRVLAPVSIVEAPPRSFDVAHFVGDPSRAAELLGWRSEVAVEDGLADLMDRLAALRAAVTEPDAA